MNVKHIRCSILYISSVYQTLLRTNLKYFFTVSFCKFHFIEDSLFGVDISLFIIRYMDMVCVCSKRFEGGVPPPEIVHII